MCPYDQRWLQKVRLATKTDPSLLSITLPFIHPFSWRPISISFCIYCILNVVSKNSKATKQKILMKKKQNLKKIKNKKHEKSAIKKIRAQLILTEFELIRNIKS